ncbi:MAG: hypothetical protein AAGK05_19305 [Pseudomonadota bacterium]
MGHKSRLTMLAAVGDAVAAVVCLCELEVELSSVRRESRDCRRLDLEKASVTGQ